MFDSVGFALEDYSALRYLADQAAALGLGEPLPLIPALANPRDLFNLVRPAVEARALADQGGDGTWPAGTGQAGVGVGVRCGTSEEIPLIAPHLTGVSLIGAPTDVGAGVPAPAWAPGLARGWLGPSH